MIRASHFGFISVLTVLLSLGLASADAQQLFVTKSKSTAHDGAKPKIFITPKGSSSKSKTKNAKIGYGQKLELAKELDFNKDQIKAYEYWKKSGQKPDSIEAMVAYAQAEKSLSYGALLERKKDIFPALEKTYSKLKMPKSGPSPSQEMADYKAAMDEVEKKMKAAGIDIELPKSPAEFGKFAKGRFIPHENKSYSKFETQYEKSGKGQKKSVTMTKKSSFTSEDDSFSH